MKKILCLINASLILLAGFAQQGVGINTDGSSPHAVSQTADQVRQLYTAIRILISFNIPGPLPSGLLLKNSVRHIYS